MSSLLDSKPPEGKPLLISYTPQHQNGVLGTGKMLLRLSCRKSIGKAGLDSMTFSIHLYVPLPCGSLSLFSYCPVIPGRMGHNTRTPRIQGITGSTHEERGSKHPSPHVATKTRRSPINTRFLQSLTDKQVQFSCSAMSNSLRPHGLRHARPPCPSPTPRAYSNSRPSSQRFHPKAKVIQHHQTSFTTNVKRTSLSRKDRELETRKLWTEKLISKGKHTVKVGKTHTQIWHQTQQPWGEFKCRILEVHLKLTPATWNNLVHIDIGCFIKASQGRLPGGTVDRNPPANAETQVWSLVWEDPTCRRATEPRYCNYRHPRTLEPMCCNYWAHAPQPESPHATSKVQTSQIHEQLFKKLTHVTNCQPQVLASAKIPQCVKWHIRVDGLKWYLYNIPPESSRIHIPLKCTKNILQDRSQAGSQSQLQ